MPLDFKQKFLTLESDDLFLRFQIPLLILMQKIENADLGRLDIEAYKQAEKIRVVVILDHIRSLNNIGSVFRTCDAFAVEKLYLCGITAKPPHREIEKTALGATESVAWEHHEDTTALIQTLHEQGYEIIAIEQADPKIYLHQFRLDSLKKYALIFGNEVEGVSEAVMQQVDHCIEIPQSGTKHSLNISVSCGAVLWEFYRQHMS